MEQQPCKVLLMELSEISKSFPLIVFQLMYDSSRNICVKRLMEENNQRSGLEIVLDDVVKIVNLICSHSKKR